KSLADRPETRQSVAKDASLLGGLVLLLSNEHRDIATAAMDILLTLGRDDSCRPLLRACPGVESQARELLAKARHSSDAYLAKQAQRLCQCLRRPKTSVAAAGGPGLNSRLAVLQLDGMDPDADVEACRRALVSIRGVISVTFSLPCCRVFLRLHRSLALATVAEALTVACPHLSVRLVVRRRQRPFGNNDDDSAGGITETLCEVPQPQQQRAAGPAYLLNDSQLLVNSPDNSASERAPKLPSPGDARRRASWFARAADFLHTSLYW
ncbi:hypothetical protein BOX15_Mlig028827g2, partial [Macrostomum lignano]